MYVLMTILLTSLTLAQAQVLAPQEVPDSASRALQQKYLAQLKSVGTELRAHQFPYPFYFSRTLDLDEQQQQRADQRSIRFDKYDGQTVLEITGNYYIAYSGDKIAPNQRVRQTFYDVMLPVLQAAVPHFAGNESFSSYALEISHHVRQKVAGMSAEKAENVVMLVPRDTAQRLVAASSPEQQQTALQDAELYLNAQPFALSLTGKPVVVAAKLSGDRPAVPAATPPALQVAPPVPAVPAHLREAPVRVITKESLAALQSANQDALARLTQKLEPQAHFVTYAPPAFIEFHQAAWLQLSLITTLEGTTSGSRYKLAALAFDEHISHLVRPLLANLPQDAAFDGVDFSTTVRAGGTTLSVEFFLPIAVLRSFAQYDSTGQQLMEAGIVLINGERAKLDLQTAEGN